MTDCKRGVVVKVGVEEGVASSEDELNPVLFEGEFVAFSVSCIAVDSGKMFTQCGVGMEFLPLSGKEER